MKADRQQRKKVRRQPRQRHKPYRGIVAEMSLKLILSWVIAIGAIASVFKLLPYHLSQQSKLKELRFQVQETNARVDKLRDELNHNFDPQQTQNLMEQYSSLTSPNQSRIYWLPEDSKQ
jgi:cell division protein FtsB